MEKALSARNITKYFGAKEEKHCVLDGVSIDVEQGEFVSVMGPSGCGKSTLLFALSGMDSIDGGEVKWGNQSLRGLEEKELADIRRTQMGFVFQQPAMVKNLNIADNIALPALQGNRKRGKAVAVRAKALMQQTGIEALGSRSTAEVSGGQLQRAGICRALINEPKLILADEPTGALNSKAAQEIMDLFSKINKENTAILLVTHDPKAAARSQRILFMCDGRIVGEKRFPKYDKTGLGSRVEQITARLQEIGI